jgi:precorrin-6A/cobalt-precorrin-6A reductase
MSWSPIAPESCLPMPGSPPPETILILGGTREAAALAQRAGRSKARGPHHHLARRTHEGTRPACRRGPHRRLRRGRRPGALPAGKPVTRLIDATHPFARQISANAVEAASIAGVPLEIRTRKPWSRQPGDTWIEVETLEQARDAIPPAPACCWRSAPSISACSPAATTCTFVVRMIDQPETPLALPDHALVLGRPGDTAASGNHAADRPRDHPHRLPQFRRNRRLCQDRGGAGFGAAGDHGVAKRLMPKTGVDPRYAIGAVAQPPSAIKKAMTG